MEKMAQNGKIFFALCPTAKIENAPKPLISVLLVLKLCHRCEALHQYCASRQGTMTDHVRQTTRQGKVKNTTWNYIAMEMLLQPLCWFCPKTVSCVPFWTDSLLSCYLLIAVRTLVSPLKCSCSHSRLHRSAMQKLSFVTQYYY